MLWNVISSESRESGPARKVFRMELSMQHFKFHEPAAHPLLSSTSLAITFSTIVDGESPSTFVHAVGKAEHCVCVSRERYQFVAKVLCFSGAKGQLTSALTARISVSFLRAPLASQQLILSLYSSLPSYWLQVTDTTSGSSVPGILLYSISTSWMCEVPPPSSHSTYNTVATVAS